MRKEQTNVIPFEKNETWETNLHAQPLEATAEVF